MTYFAHSDVETIIKYVKANACYLTYCDNWDIRVFGNKILNLSFSKLNNKELNELENEVERINKLVNSEEARKDQEGTMSPEESFLYQDANEELDDIIDLISNLRTLV